AVPWSGRRSLTPGEGKRQGREGPGRSVSRRPRSLPCLKPHPKEVSSWHVPPPVAVSRAQTEPTPVGPLDSFRKGSRGHHDGEAPGPLPAVPPALPPAVPRLARRGAGHRLPFRLYALSGEHPRGVGSPRPRRPGAHRSPVRPARAEPGDAAAGR